MSEAALIPASDWNDVESAAVSVEMTDARRKVLRAAGHVNFGKVRSVEWIEQEYSRYFRWIDGRPPSVDRYESALIWALSLVRNERALTWVRVEDMRDD